MTMATASLKLSSHLLYAFVLLIFLRFRPVYTDKEDHLIKGINIFRTSENLPALSLNRNAKCVANRIAEQFADEKKKHPCNESGEGIGLSHYPRVISKCVVNMHTTHDALVLPVCVPKLFLPLVFTNFTRTKYNRSISASDFTGIGAGAEDDWMVVVLSTDTYHGSIANGDRSLFRAKVGLIYYVVFLLLGFCNLLFLILV